MKVNRRHKVYFTDNHELTRSIGKKIRLQVKYDIFYQVENYIFATWQEKSIWRLLMDNTEIMLKQINSKYYEQRRAIKKKYENQTSS